MATLTASSLTYKFSLDEMKKLIAKDLNLAEEDISVRYIVRDTSNDEFGRYSNYNVTEIEVSVNKLKKTND